MITVTVSSKYQIVIPKEARKKLNVRPGDQLLVHLEDKQMVLRVRPHSYTQYLRGLHKEIWHDLDATEYVQHERASWGP